MRGGPKIRMPADRRSRPRGASALATLLTLLLALAATGCTKAPDETAAGDPLANGWSRFRYGEFDSAIRAFDLARAGLPPDDPRALDALFGLATTWNLRTPVGDQDKPLARGFYEDIIRRAPDSDLAAWSMLALARMQHLVPVGSEPDFRAVRTAYQSVIDRFPEHLAGHEAFIYLQSSYVQTMEEGPTRRAESALTNFIARHPGSGFLSGANQLLSTCYETLKLPEQQLAAELRALDTMEFDPSNPMQEFSSVYWRIATIAEFEAGDFDTARRFYRRLIQEYPQDIRVYAAEEALIRMEAVETDVRRTLSRGPA